MPREWEKVRAAAARRPMQLGLDRVRTAVVQVLPEGRWQPVTITVGGTNGKGSVCSMIERILRCAGYRTGLYLSPHIFSFHERIRVSGQMVTDEELDAVFLGPGAIAEKIGLTEFEVDTLAALQVFSRASVDVQILEVGLGGRLDATNAIDADCAVVSSVGIDHIHYLGETRESIGYEKAGICRAGRPLVCGDVSPPQSLAETCRHVGADLLQIGRDFGYLRQEGQWQYWGRAGRTLGGLAFPALRGACQLSNASCAIAALDTIRDRLPVTAQDIRRGLLEVSVAGRCQVLPGRPQIVLDVAHNPQAATMLADSLGDMGFAARTWAIFGIMGDKDIDGVIDAIRHRIDRWLVCDLPGERAARSGDLMAHLEKIGAGETAQTFASPAAALDFARENAGEGDRILAFGSFLTVAGVMRPLGCKA